VVRRRKDTYVDGAGRKFKVDAVRIDLKPGMKLEDVVDQYLAANTDDQIIKARAKEIKEYLEQTEQVDPLERFYELGQKLQFIDTLSSNSQQKRKGSIFMTNDRREALRRLYVDLGVDPVRKKRISQTSKVPRYGERSYMLAKLTRELAFTKGMTWSHWFDILEYHRIFQNRLVLEDLVKRCSAEGWASGKTGKLREELQRINAELQSAKR
jgi:hypothetical protein